MEAIRLTTTVAEDGKVTIGDLKPGEQVEVIVLRKPKVEPTFPLRGLGTILHYERPFDPVGEEDWEALK